MQQTCGEYLFGTMAACPSRAANALSRTSNPQSTGSFLFIRPMAGEALVGKNGSDVRLIKVNRTDRLFSTRSDDAERRQACCQRKCEPTNSDAPRPRPSVWILRILPEYQKTVPECKLTSFG